MEIRRSFWFPRCEMKERVWDDVFQWLHRAMEECDQLMMPVRSYGFLDSLHSDLRFLALLRKIWMRTNLEAE
jgi:hypothetical protein